MITYDSRQDSMILRIATAFARYIGFDDCDVASQQQSPTMSTNSPVKANLQVVNASTASKQATDHKWRRHPLLRAYEAPIETEERDARYEAVRGICAAHAGAIEVATHHFALAAACSEIDLTALPDFWKLTRGQMQAAVAAYEQVGRHQDAAALNAHIEGNFRPNLVGADRGPIVPRKLFQEVAAL